MNKIVESWKSHEENSKYQGTDTIRIDGATFNLPTHEGINAEEKRMAHPDRQIAINQDVTKELALHGEQQTVESLLAETHRTLKRLGEIAGPRTKAFRRMPRAVGGRPNLLDLIKWMNNLGPEDKFKDDRVFLKRLHVTLRGRAHLDVLKKIEKG
jgi:hypothetical protein